METPHFFLDISLIKQFCDRFDIPMLVCKRNGVVTFANSHLNGLFNDCQNINSTISVEKLLSNNAYYSDNLSNSGESTILKWTVYTEIEDQLVIVARLIPLDIDTLSSSGIDIEALPFSLYVKDRSGVYIYGNELINNIAKVDDITNKTDDELGWSQYAKELINNDQKAMTANKPQYFFEKISYQHKPYLFLSTKTFRDDLLYVMSINLTDVHHDFLSNYMQINSREKLKLTSKEIRCLKWLIKGKSAWEISQITQTSKKTCEWHIANIKRKFGCYKSTKLSYLAGRYHAYLSQYIT